MSEILDVVPRSVEGVISVFLLFYENGGGVSCIIDVGLDFLRNCFVSHVITKNLTQEKREGSQSFLKKDNTQFRTSFKSRKDRKIKTRRKQRQATEE